MKKFKLFSVLVFCTLFIQTLSAQFDISISGGVNKAGISLNPKDSGVSLTPNSIGVAPIVQSGFYISAMPSIGLTKNIFFNTEFQFSREGYTMECGLVEDFLDKDFVERKVDYLRFVPTVEMRIKNKLAIYSGLNMALKLNEDTTTINEGCSVNEMNLADINNTVSNFDFSIPLGFRFFVDNFFFNASYSIGLHNVNNLMGNHDLGGYENLDIKKSHFQVGIGYRIGA